jgi:Fusaric acid resistance protein-like
MLGQDFTWTAGVSQEARENLEPASPLPSPAALPSERTPRLRFYWRFVSRSAVNHPVCGTVPPGCVAGLVGGRAELGVWWAARLLSGGGRLRLTGRTPTGGDGAVGAVGVSDKPSGARRAIHILGAVVVVVVLPAVVIGVLVGEQGAAAMISGLLFGVLGSKLGGYRRMMYLAPGVGVAAGLGAFTAYDWGWVALLTVVGVVVGAGIGFGWLPPLLMLAYAGAFAGTVSSARDAIVYGVIVGIAALYGVVLARRFGVPGVVDGQRVPIKTAVVVAIVFGVALGASAAIGVALSWAEPYWVPEPILILVLYILMGKRERIREKAIGTAVGVVAALPVAIIAPPAGAIGLLALVAFVLALTQLKTYWLYYGLFTFSLVLALSAPGHVGTEAAHRGSEILVGIGILVVGLAVINAAAGWLAKHYPQPELADTATT